ncbi:hypothetical protein CO165_01885 [Candidatus Roizmanbacteria bacterium CG_4_9_14_3_um_filter_33_18]|uniref:Uncharacterized protein n=3 Tax=Candidatus Roizmaniibacteriota TaxID=1752723 RepID=A0A2M7U6R1_9BACT|nr:MAG: hypothetical protein COW97_01630 [Candidatus Roizmanbacteria bacterium CG22_combo_CG10-13_8_21_14_all_34_12]PIZ66925.1 MAG: hypothetical protein COY12_02595 [Candidatus Roizmanbacteria bacterium CG_4_10_14_0_2_um_filter_33_96]PJA55765.1 MAG: hypothetical protein CO165_01885 [Candidatus Roizmanbacteria bacterium CG_4_9_14_3_um_filter_33_18]
MKEARRFEHIENQVGFGYFSLAIHEGGLLSQVSNIPALKMEEHGDEEKYIEQQRKKNGPLPIIAFRSGGRGYCNIVVDRSLIEVKTVNLSIPRDRVNIHQEPVIQSVIEVFSIPANKFYETLLVPPGVKGIRDELVSSLEITAQTGAGLPFKATVSFVPSK